MPTCKQIANDIASDALSTASWNRRASVRLHLLLCRHCRRYARQMRAIGSAVRTVFGHHEDDADARERLEKIIDCRTKEASRETLE